MLDLVFPCFPRSTSSCTQKIHCCCVFETFISDYMQRTYTRVL